MKLLILGAQGLVGRTLQEVCKRRGISFFAAGRAEADLSDLASVKKTIQAEEPTHLINCAAYTAVDRAEVEVDQAMAINAEGPEKLGRLAKENGFKLLHISTDYVFSGSKNAPYVESDPCDPIGIYGKSKREGEKRLLEVFPEACVVRTSWVFGKGGKNFLASLFSLMSTKEEVKISADQRSRGTYAKDLAEALLHLLPQKGILHFANEGACSRFEMAQDLYREIKAAGTPLKCQSLIPVSSKEFPGAEIRPTYSVLNTHRVESVLGLKPRHWKEVLKEYLADEKS